MVNSSVQPVQLIKLPPLLELKDVHVTPKLTVGTKLTENVLNVKPNVLLLLQVVTLLMEKLLVELPQPQLEVMMLVPMVF